MRGVFIQNSVRRSIENAGHSGLRGGRYIPHATVVSLGASKGRKDVAFVSVTWRFVLCEGVPDGNGPC